MQPIILYSKNANYSDVSLSRLKKYFKVISYDSDEDISSKIKSAEVLITSIDSFYSQSLLKNATRLRYVVSNTTGINHIELPDKKNIQLIYLNEADEINDIKITAELSIGLIFCLLRNLRVNVESVLSEKWERYLAPGSSFFGKKIGIIGLGRLGSMVADYCSHMGGRIFFFDPYIDNSHGYIKKNTLEEIFSECEIVSVHVKLTTETKGLINYKVLSKSNKGMLLVNTSRGEIIVEDDLIKAMENKIISGAALDVLKGEQDDKFTHNNALLEYHKQNSSLIITPHIGGACKDARIKTENIVINKIFNKYEI